MKWRGLVAACVVTYTTLSTNLFTSEAVLRAGCMFRPTRDECSLRYVHFRNGIVELGEHCTQTILCIRDIMSAPARFLTVGRFFSGDPLVKRSSWR